MSVKELVLKDEVGNSLKFKDMYGGVLLKIDDGNSIKNAYLDRNQSHLLYLYLKERFDR